MVGIDRLGRNAAEVMTTIRDLAERGIVLRSLREGVDTSSASGRIAASVELELELGRERSAAARDARRARGQSIVAQRLSTTPRRRWRGGCMPVASPRTRLPPHSASVAPPYIGC